MNQNNDKKNNLASADYDRVLLRLTKDLKSSEAPSWDVLQEKIHDAVELEMAAAEMTRDEMDLLKAYLYRDLKKLGYYAHETGEGIAAWLKFDLNVLEQTLVEQLKQIADQTRIGHEELRERLDHDEDQYLAGELATVGTLECLECGHQLTLQATEKLENCSACQGKFFKRVSSPWP